jgi:hypothetical protein
MHMPHVPGGGAAGSHTFEQAFKKNVVCAHLPIRGDATKYGKPCVLKRDVGSWWQAEVPPSLLKRKVDILSNKRWDYGPLFCRATRRKELVIGYQQKLGFKKSISFESTLLCMLGICELQSRLK